MDNAPKHNQIKRYAALFFGLWATFMLMMNLQKPLFMLFEPGYDGLMSEVFSVMWHGLGMDLAVSAYMVAPILLWLMARIWADNKTMTLIIEIWLWTAASLIALASVLDAVLFPYWGFRLDSTPLFYMMSSPAAAMASLPWWGNLLVFVAAVAVAFGFGWLLIFVYRKLRPTGLIEGTRRRVWLTVGTVCVGASMIIPIRGGVTVSTMSPGKAYYSNNMMLNYAAVNPLFNFLYSVTHSDNLSEQFRFFDDSKATALMKELYTPQQAAPDSLTAMPRLTKERPDVYLIILESFSSHLLTVQGGENIAPGLDALAREGVLFTRFYAESFRTDRAIPAIISGYPSQPTTSMLRYINKFNSIPSLATILRPLGYRTHYYYGGDIDFTNVGAYLVSSGFEHIVSDKDFPIGEKMSKWGAHDGVVYDRLLADIGGWDGSHPDFVVVQTSSSHEPFEVPFDKFDNKRANSFAYADDCLKKFTDAMKRSGEWDNALIVIVPDHWGCYPEDLTDYEKRHHIPLVLTGGAIDGHGMRIDRIGSQSAIAGTIGALLGADVSSMPLSRNLLDKRLPQWAWMSEPGWFGMVTPAGVTVISTDSPKLLRESSQPFDADHAKAFVQKLYDDLDKR